MGVSGELKQWHAVTLDFDGPQRGENATTFRDYRLDVTFTNQGTGETMTVPGYFAGDGDSANTNASSGSVWRVKFTPPSTGTWDYEVNFRTGDDVAVSLNPNAGQPGGFMDGETGSFAIAASDKTGDDLRGKGALVHDDDQYLNFAGTDEVFIKSGVGSPENMLAFSGFDNTPDSHDFQPHVQDWNNGDPTWDGGKGKGLVGAMNYLADQGVNSFYFIANTVGGDGRDVWPWAASDLNKISKNAGNNINLTSEAQVFDVSKLDQWDIVFSHMQELGIVLHMFFQETENDQLLNDGNLGLERQLFIREMVARFGHHNGLIFNLGEENTNTAGQLRDHSSYTKALDAYDRPVTLHTFPGQTGKYDDFAGEETLDALSIQTSNENQVPNLDRLFRDHESAGRPVAAFLDEPGSANIGAAAEGDNGWQSNHENLLETLWRFNMDGGSGAEWYFGYQTQNGNGGDLELEDFRTRETLFQKTEGSREFFEDLPLEQMVEADGLAPSTVDVRAKAGEVYALFARNGGTVTLDLSGQGGQTFDVFWYDPYSTNPSYVQTAIATVSGGGVVDLGQAPYDTNRPWALKVEASDATPPTPTLFLSLADAVISENGETTTATVSRNGDLTGALTVQISIDDASEASAPVSVTIGAGQASQSFAVTGVNDDEEDGAQAVTVSAAAEGFVGASAGLTVSDDDAPIPPSGLSIFLINAATDENLGQIGSDAFLDPALLDGAPYSIKAEYEGSAGSIRFFIDGVLQQTENIQPYALFGDSSGDYDGQALPAEPFDLTVVAYSGSGGSGSILGEETYDLTFTAPPPPPPPPPSDAVIAEAGSVVLTDEWLTLDLEHSFTNPVVIASVTTFNGPQPVNVRIREAEGDQVVFALEEPETYDGRHNGETVNYLVVEAGSHVLADGTRIEAGLMDTDQLSTSNGPGAGAAFTRVNFDTDFGDTPVVLSQVQSFNGSDWLTTRMRGQTEDRFAVTLQEQESFNLGGDHVTETVGWLAVEAGTGAWSGAAFEAGSAAIATTPTPVAFQEAFETAPIVVSGVSSANGLDVVIARTRGHDEDGFRAFLQEETSFDAETEHNDETLDFLALGATGVLRGVTTSTPPALAEDALSALAPEADLAGLGASGDLLA